MAEKQDAKGADVKKDSPTGATAGLVKVKKGDEVQYVHPTALADHARLGWKTLE